MIQKNWQELIKPGKLEIEGGRDPKRHATATAEPLERGFGMTLGNALRRVLLSSLRGAAITSVHIDGVLHEFSSIAGVREDVTNIVLNIKEIALKAHSEGTKRMILQKTGPGIVRAGDIEVSSEIEVLNPEHVICTLDERGRVMSSPDFAKKLGGWRDAGRQDLALIIGGADGIDPNLRAEADFSISFGSMVWPHMLVRVMLAEQLYRAATILSGGPYHRV